MEEDQSDSLNNEKKAFRKFLEKQSDNYRGLKEKISNIISNKKGKENIEEILDYSSSVDEFDEDFDSPLNPDLDEHFDRYEMPKDEKKSKSTASILEEEFHFDRYESRKERD